MTHEQVSSPKPVLKVTGWLKKLLDAPAAQAIHAASARQELRQNQQRQELLEFLLKSPAEQADYLADRAITIWEAFPKGRHEVQTQRQGSGKRTFNYGKLVWIDAASLRPLVDGDDQSYATRVRICKVTSNIVEPGCRLTNRGLQNDQPLLDISLEAASLQRRSLTERSNLLETFQAIEAAQAEL